MKESRELGKVLITGGAGFIGGFLAGRLAREGTTVHIVDSLVRGRRDEFLRELLNHENVTLFEIDLMQPRALEGLGTDYSVVFHLAAILGVQNVLERPYKTLRDNVFLLENVIAWAHRQTALRRLVFASTSEVYAGSLEHLDMPIPTPEDTALALPDLGRPRSSYMMSKLYGEAMIRHSSLPFTIVRPHNVYGPRMGLVHVVPQLLEKAHFASAGAAIEVFSVDHRRTFCFVEDAVEMITRSSGVDKCQGRVLNVGSESPEISMRELATIIISTVGKPLEIAAKPPTEGSPARRCPKMSNMVELTGYRSRTSLEEGVARTYEWYRSHVFEGGEDEVAT